MRAKQIFVVLIGTSLGLSSSTLSSTTNEKGGCGAIPCDVHWPSNFKSSHASTVCVPPHEAHNEIDEALDAARVTVVYGASLLGEPVTHGYGIAVAQLESLHAVGLLCPGCARVHIVLTHVPTSPLISDNDPVESERSTPRSENENIKKNVKSLNTKPSFGKHLSGRDTVAALTALAASLSGGEATIRVLWENHWEWPALADAHAMGQQLQQKQKQQATRLPSESRAVSAPIFLYFHNKGASHVRDAEGAATASQFRTMDTLGGGWGRRSLAEMAAFHEVVAPWQAVLQLFDLHSEAVQHAGLAPAKGGFQWFNFMWARPAYLAMHLPPAPPLRGLDRHYYESWLGRALNHTALMNAAGTTVNPADGGETLAKGHKRRAARSEDKAEILDAKSRQAMVSTSSDGGCAVAYSLADCQVGSCGTAKWAEARLTRAKKRLDAAFRQTV